MVQYKNRGIIHDSVAYNVTYTLQVQKRNERNLQQEVYTHLGVIPIRGSEGRCLLLSSLK